MKQRLEHDREVVPQRGQGSLPPRAVVRPAKDVSDADREKEGAPPVRAESASASPICAANACI